MRVGLDSQNKIPLYKKITGCYEIYRNFNWMFYENKLNKVEKFRYSFNKYACSMIKNIALSSFFYFILYLIRFSYLKR